MDVIFTAVIPAFNAEATIERTIRSLLNQSRADIEIIVLDNGSTDRTIEIVQSIDSPRLHIRQYPHLTQLGASLNRAFGLEFTSKYFSICHSDDIYHSSYVSSMIDYMEKNPKTSILFCTTHLIDESDRRISSVYWFIKDLFTSTFSSYTGLSGALRLYMWNNVVAPTAMYRSELCGFYDGFSTSLTYYTDLSFWTSHLLKGGVISVLPRKYVLYRMHANQLSANCRFSEKQRLELTAVKKKILSASHVPRLVRFCVEIVTLLRVEISILLRS